MTTTESVIPSDPEIMGGTPVIDPGLGHSWTIFHPYHESRLWRLYDRPARH